MVIGSIVHVFFLKLFIRRMGVLMMVVAAGLFLAAGAQAADFVSIKNETVNVRAQASTSSEILWKLTRGYPLQVEQKQGDWVKVRDFEETLGWVYAPLVTNAPHRVVKVKVANLRSGPGTNNSVVGKMEQYEVVRTLASQNDWVQIQRSNGQKGWISANLTWGW